jgi:hypothetical protein
MSNTNVKLFTTIRYDPDLLQAHANPSFSHAGWNFSHQSSCYMLDLHRDRILRAATYWQWATVTSLISGDDGLTRLEMAIENFLAEDMADKDKAYRLRILVNEEGELKFERADETPRTLEALFPATLLGRDKQNMDAVGPVFTVICDEEGTERSAYTHYKTTKRQMYDDARRRAGIKPGEAREVLIINGVDGSIMEGSVTTPYFFREGKWVTPPVPAVFEEENGRAGQDGTTRRWGLMK